VSYYSSMMPMQPPPGGHLSGLGFSLKPPKWLRKAAPTILKTAAVAAGVVVAGPAALAAASALAKGGLALGRRIAGAVPTSTPPMPAAAAPNPAPTPAPMLGPPPTGGTDPAAVYGPSPVAPQSSATYGPSPYGPYPVPDSPGDTISVSPAGLPSWALPAGLGLVAMMLLTKRPRRR